MHRWFAAGSAVLFVVGAASLALTLYLWFGDWPAQARHTVDHLRSVAAHSGRVPDPLLPDPEVLQPFLLRYYLPATLGFVRDEWRFRIDDGLEAIVDVPALNEYFGWYYAGAD